MPVDPVIANYIKDYLPLPNIPGTNNFEGDPVAHISDNQFIFRLDYTLSKKDTLSGVYIVDDSPDIYPFQVINGGSSGGDVPVGRVLPMQTDIRRETITWTRTISPTILNELRFAEIGSPICLLCR